MRFHISLSITLLIALYGCSNIEETPARTSEDVLRTAEAIAAQTRQSSTATPVIPTQTATPEPPEATPTPVVTATPEDPMVEALYNANVRSGPDENYPIIDIFFQEQLAEAIGRYDHPNLGSWWFIRRVGEGLNGWVWGGAVNFYGSPALVPFFDPPPTPTSSPLPTDPPPPTETPTEDPTS